MLVTSNISASHFDSLRELISGNCDELILVSPFLASDLGLLFRSIDFSTVKSIILITTLKANSSDQLDKPKSLNHYFHL